ncbi:hypothetical protein MUK60_07295 [Streptomyces sp. LRE541]|uniref:hypothetical protein n=1 Tax=Streptomyces sp. LRE541 TaxID=2931983 RepID=UPI00200C2EA8|nr:hypothetical protein [Streptomyces sp. LRE541]UPZ27637.1 hypothetical protein MUK60_07295 [Streptomyces sp. LRE541]
MARLQILELPEVFVGEASETPFVLVVDEYEPRRYIMGPDQNEQPINEFDGIAEKVGARCILAFADTVDIPANDLSGYNGIPGGDYTAFAATVGRVLGIDTSSVAPDVAGWLLTACRELEKSEAAREQLRQERDAQAESLERVRNLHRPVDYRGTMICAECSAFGGSTTDNAPVAHNQCGTLHALISDQLADA